MATIEARRTVAIIGCGAGGIITAKILRDRGFDVTIFEAESNLGGTWRYQENPSDSAGIAPCYKSLRTNASREMMELSDFEFSAPTLFPRHEVVHGYLDSYARHFGIIDGSEQIVQFGRTVTKVEKDAKTKKWHVTTMDSVHQDAEEMHVNSEDEDTGSGFMYSPSLSSLSSANNNSTGSLQGAALGAQRLQSLASASPLPPANNVPYYAEQRPSLARRPCPGTDVCIVISDEDLGPCTFFEPELEFDGGVRTDTFDMVVVATGAYRVPQIPKIPGLDDFQGTVLHSVEYRRPQPLFVKKRVLVVGLGSSAIDIALEAKNFASEVQLTSRRGSWLLPRFYKSQPYDHLLTRATAMVPAFLRDWFIKRVASYVPQGHRNESLPLRRSRLTPDSGLGVLVQSGDIVVSDALQRFSANAAHFNDGSSFRCDVVMLCTGFQRSYDYFPESILPKSQHNRPPLFRHVFLPDVDGLAFVGACKVAGAVLPVIEMQARWISHVFAGDVSLPPREVMRERATQLSSWASGSGEDHLYVRDRIGYLDSLAAEIGAKPRLWKWSWDRLKLLPTLLLGPAEAWHYRLDGPQNFADIICKACYGQPPAHFDPTSDHLLPSSARPVRTLSFSGDDLLQVPIRPQRRRKTLPGCDHLHRLDPEGRTILFYEARTDYYDEWVRRALKLAVLGIAGTWLLGVNRRRIWSVIKWAASYYIYDFMEVGKPRLP